MPPAPPELTDWDTIEDIYESLKAFRNNLPGTYSTRKQVTAFHNFLDRLMAAGLEMESHQVPDEFFERKVVRKNMATGERTYSKEEKIGKDELLSHLEAVIGILERRLERHLWSSERKPVSREPSSPPANQQVSINVSATGSGRDTIQHNVVIGTISSERREQYRNVINDARKALNEAPPPQDAGDLRIELDILERELEKEKPDSTKLQRGLEWLSSVAQGLVSNALWAKLFEVVSSLPQD